MVTERIICVANRKGGVGKTTTAVSLAAAMSRGGCRTLLVDLDLQCNATSGLGAAPLASHPLVSGQSLTAAIVPTSVAGLDLLPGCRGFHDAEALAREDGPVRARMLQQLSTELTGYECVLFDCPPSMGPLTQMALAWSKEVLMPIQCEYYAMEGLAQMIEIIAKIIHQRKGQLAIGGVVLTMYDPTLELTGEVEDQVRDFFGEIVYRTVIPRDVCLSEAPSHGLSIFEYAPRSRGARAYAELCLEVLERV
ncbi:MAG: ParA family protein [Planctomycetia bacterium]|nr:ParA family protein [Planctomycetia bacterium]